MKNRSWLIEASVLSFLAINTGQLPAVATKNLVNKTVQPILISINRPVLKLGSQGVQVSELQAALKLLGYFGGAVNGFYGESTASAVSRFQQASGLSADGIAGEATWNRLFPSIPVADTSSLPTVTNNRQTASTNSASGFPVPSSLQRTNVRDSRVNVTPPLEPVRPPTPVSDVSTVVTLPILRQGMQGSAIAQLQERLKNLGFFFGSVDGVFGEATQAAVKAAQQKFNLEPDGIVGSATWSAIMR